jgi:hypothetical protein
MCGGSVWAGVVWAGVVWAGALVFFILISGGHVAAETPATQPAGAAKVSIERMLGNLANPDPQVRLAGRSGLMRLMRRDLPQLRAIVEKVRPLLPSQAAALRQIVREIYLAGEKYEPDPNAFMGIMMDPSSVQADFVPENDSASTSMGVIVADCIPGFCASRGLLEGDIILGVSNPFEPFHNSGDLTKVIGGMPAGTSVKLLVLRRGQLIEVSLTLDAHPHEIPTSEQVPLFRAEREKKFETFWRREFEPLIAGMVG